MGHDGDGDPGMGGGAGQQVTAGGAVNLAGGQVVTLAG